MKPREATPQPVHPAVEYGRSHVTVADCRADYDSPDGQAARDEAAAECRRWYQG